MRSTSRVRHKKSRQPSIVWYNWDGLSTPMNSICTPVDPELLFPKTLLKTFMFSKLYLKERSSYFFSSKKTNSRFRERTSNLIIYISFLGKSPLTPLHWVFSLKFLYINQYYFSNIGWIKGRYVFLFWRFYTLW